MNSLISHRVAALRYSLTDQPLSLEPLRILEERTVTWNDWQVTFYVLGTSHAVRLQRGDVCLTEVLSCLPPPDDIPMILRADMPAEANHTGLILQRDSVQCTILLTPFMLANGDQFKGTFQDGCQISRSYPVVDGLPAPVTRIGWEINPISLLIETIHTYPEEERGIRSLTRFTREVIK